MKISPIWLIFLFLTACSSPLPTTSQSTASPTFSSPIDLSAGANFQGVALVPDNLNSLQKMNVWGKGSAEWASYSPDGLQVAIATKQIFYLYQAGSDTQIYTIPAPAGHWFVGVDISDDWQWLALGLNNDQIAIYALVDGTLQYQLTQKITDHLQFLPNSTVLLTKRWGWDVATNQPITTNFPGGFISADGQTVIFSNHNTYIDTGLFISQLILEGNQLQASPPRSLSIPERFRFILAPDGSKLANENGDVIEVWDIETEMVLYKIDLQFSEQTGTMEGEDSKSRRSVPAQRSGPVRYYGTAVTFSPDGQWLIAADRKGDLLFFEAETGQLKQRWADATGVAIWASFTADMSKFLVLDNSVTEWSMTGEKLFEHVDHQSKIYDVAFTPQNNLVLGVYDLLLLNTPQLQTQTYLNNHVTQLALINDGETVVYFYDQNLFFYHLPTQKLTSLTNEEKDNIYQFFISPDEQWVAFSNFRNRGQVWSLNDWSKTLEVLSSPTQETITFTPDNQYFVHSNNVDKAIDFWRLPPPNTKTTPQPEFALPMPENRYIIDMVISPNGQYLVARSPTEDHRFATFFIYDLPTQAIAATIEGQSSETYFLPKMLSKMLFTPDGQLLVIATEGLLTFWRTSDWEMVREIEISNIYNFAISADGQLLAVTFYDGHLELWGIPQP